MISNFDEDPKYHILDKGDTSVMMIMIMIYLLRYIFAIYDKYVIKYGIHKDFYVW